MKRQLTYAGAIGIVLIAGAALSFFYFSHGHAKPAPSAPIPTPEAFQVAPGFPEGDPSTVPNIAATSSVLKPPRTPPQGAREYRNTTYRFALFYPQALGVKEYDEGNGARTIVFQNVGAAQGFQIFVVPYGASQVSLARFKEDEPSGVVQEPQTIQIDGALATIFIGSNVALGDTREVWFLHGGYLFEVTAPKSLDAWLAHIMQTWEFL